MHFVFRARGSKMHRHAKAIIQLWQTLGKRHDVRVYRFSNNANHLHLLVRGKHRHGLQSFLRVFAGRVAQLVGGCVKAAKGDVSFWLVPVYSRIVGWGPDFFATTKYVIQNRLEAAGLIPYQPRRRQIKERGPPLS